MGWSFRESVKILPGVRLSFSRRGVSASIGTKGLHLGVGGGRAPRITGGFGPLHYYRSLGTTHEHSRAVPARRPARRGRAGAWAVFVVIVGLLCGWLWLPPGWLTAHLRSTLPTLFSAPAPARTVPGSSATLPSRQAEGTPAARPNHRVEAARHRPPHERQER